MAHGSADRQPTSGKTGSRIVAAPSEGGQRAARASVTAIARVAPLRISTMTCQALSELDPQGLGLTYAFDADQDGDPYAVTVRFEGRRVGVKRKPGARDRFEVSTTVDPVLPGSGRVTITARVADIAAGQWRVLARPIRDPQRRRRDMPEGLPTNHLPAASAVGATAWLPVVQVRAPGARLGVWPALVGAGAAVALTVQAPLAAHLHLPVLPIVLVSLLACLIGVAGAKGYYLALHPAERHRLLLSGMCIQGFVLAAVATLVIGVWLIGAPVGTALDITAPGLLFGMAVGRFGCFFGGCCAGRPTVSRWGLWSSDRRVGVRRIPTQLLEAALAAVIGAVSLALLLSHRAPSPAGAVFVGAFAAYTLGRQPLFPLRGLARQTRHGRIIVMTAAAAVLAVDVLVAALS